MPLGFQRLNEKWQRPNANINFIKLDAHQSPADQAIAHDFLSRIAAQCYPVMKEHYISVMSLEEYPPNPEFLGRNFNAGECIQLVLKDKAGRWLSFKFVQMVMMHELAHCKQMNHSRFFWNVRNEYAKVMEGLWAKGYKGEGLWGRGKDLVSGEFVHDRMPEDAQIPQHLCGGTYRRARGKKRKRGQAEAEGEKPKLSYAERQQKRIARKFGKHGDGAALGEDELVRGALDRQSGKRQTGKPRVAGSKRGRELRANAALARFDAIKTQKAREETPELEDDEVSETESGWSSDDDVDSSESIVLRKKAGQIKDQDGNDMFKVCGDEGEDEDGGQDEMDELRMLSGKPKSFPENTPKHKPSSETKADGWPKATDEGSETESEADAGEHGAGAVHDGPLAEDSSAAAENADGATPASLDEEPSAEPPLKASPPPAPITANKAPPPAPAPPSTPSCPICSLENERSAHICIACSHVLKPKLMRDHWRCRSDACTGSQYINAGDVGRCGLCGAQKPTTTMVGAAAQAGHGRPVGLVGNEVLRWD